MEIKKKLTELEKRIENLELRESDIRLSAAVMGGKKSNAKTRTARENGKKGGRPKLPSTPPPAS